MTQKNTAFPKRTRSRAWGTGMKKMAYPWLLGFMTFLLAAPAIADDAPDARTIVMDCYEYMREKASVCEIDMKIHRSDWQRLMSIKIWTRGISDSIFFITAPPKDRRSGSLKKGREMWVYNPRVNRVLKLPPSMMSQSWQGSDFSNNDLAKSDIIINEYDHTLEGVEEHDGMKVYRIRSVPKPDAPVVWGMQRLKIRDDNILLAQDFFDEDHKLVKAMSGNKIRMMGGKMFASEWKMKKAGKTEEYTLLQYKTLEFLQDLPPSMFTLAALKNPKR